MEVQKYWIEFYLKKTNFSAEKKLIQDIYSIGGLELLTKLYYELPNWDAKANLVKYFLREDREVHDTSLLERYQKEFYDHLIEQGSIIDVCKVKPEKSR